MKKSVTQRAVWSACLVGWAAASLAADQDNYQLLTVGQHQQCLITVNGFPLKQFGVADRLSSRTMADPYLVHGTNVFVVRCAESATNSAASESGIARLLLDYGGLNPTNRAENFNLMRQTFASDGLVEKIEIRAGSSLQYAISAKLEGVRTRHVIELDTRQSAYAHLIGSGTNAVEVRANLAMARLTSLPWTGSTPILSDADRTSIRAVVAALQQAMAAKDVDQVVASLARRAARQAEACGRSVNDEVADIRLTYNGLFADPAYAVAPLDTGLLEFRTFDNVNLVQVLLNGEPPILATGGAGDAVWRYRIAVYVSKIDGQWCRVD